MGIERLGLRHLADNQCVHLFRLALSTGEDGACRQDQNEEEYQSSL